jgi:hypothetical protein
MRTGDGIGPHSQLGRLGTTGAILADQRQVGRTSVSGPSAGTGWHARRDVDDGARGWCATVSRWCRPAVSGLARGTAVRAWSPGATAAQFRDFAQRRVLRRELVGPLLTWRLPPTTSLAARRCGATPLTESVDQRRSRSITLRLAVAGNREAHTVKKRAVVGSAAEAFEGADRRAPRGGCPTPSAPRSAHGLPFARGSSPPLPVVRRRPRPQSAVFYAGVSALLVRPFVVAVT